MVPFGALVDFRLPEPYLKALPKMASRALPGLFLGWHLHAGGRWSGDYLCSPLQDWEDSSQRKKVRIFRVKEIVFDPSDITFPMRAVRDKKTRAIKKPRRDDKTKPVVIDDDGGKEAEELTPKDLEVRLPSDAVVASFDIVPLPDINEEADSPDFAPGTEPVIPLVPEPDHSGGPDAGGGDVPGPPEEQAPLPAMTKWERRSDPFRPVTLIR